MNYSQKPDGLKFDLLQFGWFNPFLDPFFEEIVNLWMRMADSTCVTCYAMGTQGAGRVICSILDHSTCF